MLLIGLVVLPAHADPDRAAKEVLLTEIIVSPTEGEFIELHKLNEFQFRGTTETLAGNVLTNLLGHEVEDEQYTYVFDGNSQVLDHILVSERLYEAGPEFDVVHVNADRPELSQAADHEPLVTRLTVPPRYINYLPVIFKRPAPLDE